VTRLPIIGGRRRGKSFFDTVEIVEVVVMMGKMTFATDDDGSPASEDFGPRHFLLLHPSSPRPKTQCVR
jgi:hypothetical protein